MSAFTLRSALGLGLAVSGFATAGAAPTYTVSLDDPGGVHAAYYQAVTTDVQAAGAAWASAFGGGGNATIGIEVAFSPALPTEQGASTTSHLVGQDPRSGVPVYEQGAAAKLKGDARDGPGVDGRITIGDSFFSALWLDPSPASGPTLVPAGKVDAYSVFLHEFGHIFAFNGWRDGETGALSADYESTFDRWVVAQGGTLFFEGPEAEAVHGGPVPLTWGDYGHVGNGAGRPGQDLVPDLMNGIAWHPGVCYGISPLDLAIAADAGLPVAGPTTELLEPPSLVLLGSSCLLAVLCSRRRSWGTVRHLA